ncbi:MAG: DEAD/DEAH box helicase family protein [Alphaproteobacteria bacterium]|nr:DEAD/DEAH box helicase family protein [Alphaproteobacteria bacterium]
MASSAKTLDGVLGSIGSLKTTKAKGNAFERFTKWFLENDPVFASRFASVEVWSKWKYNDGQDTGIDLVAMENDGTWCAIQCKYHEDRTHQISQDEVKGLVAKTKSLSQKHKSQTQLDEYTMAEKVELLSKKHNKEMHMMFVHSGGDLSMNAEKMLRDTNCAVVNYHRFRSSGITNWDPDRKSPRVKKQSLLNHQAEALTSVMEGFKDADRGQLIMACGTGKTRTALAIAERQVGGGGGWVLYVVPSISLIHQTLDEWSRHASISHHYVVVCSDDTVKVDQGSVLDLPYPATTDIGQIRSRMGAKTAGRMGVVFCTYQSVSRLAGIKFDLMVCDEAHRTTGLKDDSPFRMVHDNRKLPAKKRLYMTATPRVYRGGDEKENARYSMDNEVDYGKRLFHYSFARAVEEGNLANVGIRVPVVPEEDMERFMDESEYGYTEETIDERILLAAVWHGLNYGTDEDGNEEQRELLQRVIAFTDGITASESFAGKYQGPDRTPDESHTSRAKAARESGKSSRDRSFAKSVHDYENRYREPTNNRVVVRHVDGTMKSSIRNRKLDWVRDSDEDPRQCRILSNARCLSEGIDVPALDGVIFLQPRESPVDVIQAVGRVMRKSGNKKMGYIIVPIVKPKGMTLEESFHDKKNKPWMPLWKIINAIRSHDETMEAKLSRINLGKGGGKGDFDGINTEIIWMGSFKKTPLSELFGELKTAMVDKIVNVKYYDNEAKELGEKAREITEIMQISNNPKLESVLDDLTSGLKHVINDSVDRRQAMEVLSQHLVMSGIFDVLFPKEFRSGNPVSAILDDAVGRVGFKQELGPFKEYFEKMTREIRKLRNDQKQDYIKRIYGPFLTGYDKKKQESQGIVYTPTEAVDFIIHSTEFLIRQHFNTGFNCHDVNILDPFTGTGTFVAQLLESGLIKPAKIVTKYQNDIWANEITLLAYYVAAANIGMVFRQVTGLNRFLPFKHINYTDTLNQHPRYQSDAEARKVQTKLAGVFEKIDRQIQDLKWEHIHVIMGNPPYSAGQKKFDDYNANLKYPKIDERIKSTYGRATTTQRQVALFDSYVRSIRWMSDRLSNKGVIGIITNGSFMRTETTAGMRASLVEEFDEIWCLDLRGNQRTSGDESDREGGKIFGSSSRAPVAIIFLVKDPQKKGKKLAEIYYKDIGYYLDREQKIDALSGWKSIRNITDWKKLTPDRHNDWLDQRNEEFYKYLLMGSNTAKSKKDDQSIFRLFSLGIVTSRDVWVYNSSRQILQENMEVHIKYCLEKKSTKNHDKSKGKFTRGLKDRLKKHNVTGFVKEHVRIALYRPFFKQYMYCDKVFNQEQYQIMDMFPNDDTYNRVIVVPSKFSGEFSTLMIDTTPDLELIHHGQCFPLYTYTNGKKIENILDTTLNEYRRHYADPKITKEDIFYYVYGLLHHPKYRVKFANNLSKELPRIPMAPDFARFSDIGRKLADLHIGYENLKEIPSIGKPRFIPKEFSKLSFGKKIVKIYGKKRKRDDQSVVFVDGHVLFNNIPITTYMVNGRTPLAWVVNRYRISHNKDTDITNDPCTGTDIIAIIERAVHIGLESKRLIDQLPKEFEPKDYKGSFTGQKTVGGDTALNMSVPRKSHTYRKTRIKSKKPTRRKPRDRKSGRIDLERLD